MEEEEPAEASVDGEQPSVSTVAEENKDFDEDSEEYFELTALDTPSLDIFLTPSKSSGIRSDGTVIPALVQPAGKLFLQPGIADKCCHMTANCLSSTCLTCSGTQFTPGGYFLQDERDMVAHTAARGPPAPEGTEHTPLVSEYDPEDRDYTADEAAGLYRDWLPVLAPVLLRGERILPAIAPLTAPYLLLSRTTQRILRDVHSLRADKDVHHMEASLMRFLTHNMQVRPPLSRLGASV